MNIHKKDVETSGCNETDTVCDLLYANIFLERMRKMIRSAIVWSPGVSANKYCCIIGMTCYVTSNGKKLWCVYFSSSNETSQKIRLFLLCFHDSSFNLSFAIWTNNAEIIWCSAVFNRITLIELMCSYLATYMSSSHWI